MNKLPVQSRTVVVTGCSSGIGKATALLLREQGWQVIPTARKAEDLQKLTDLRFHPVKLDLADGESIRSAAAHILQQTGNTLGALVNNAGYCQAGALEDLSADVLRQQFEANVFGSNELTRLLLPVFRRQNWGRIVNISSVFGRISSPMVGAYCASKYAVESLSDTWRIELWRTGIGLSIVEPGAIITEFRRNAAHMLEQTASRETSRFNAVYAKEIERRKRQKKKRDFFTRPPEEVAIKVLHALESRRPRRRYPVTPCAYLVDAVVRFVPQAWTDRLLARRLPRPESSPKEAAR
ncbi:MAG: SDR family NAD(P)-dependent oxidoreductase [Verrucomicrobiota bacterium]|nr:SDR family NAD(P)-dependent oxidoreductase [Verrucomicrobiota bacterium]